MGDVIDFGKRKAPIAADTAALVEEPEPPQRGDPAAARMEKLERIRAAAKAALTANDHWTVFCRAVARLENLRAEQAGEEHAQQLEEHKAVCADLMKASARSVMRLMKDEPEFRRHIMRHGKLPMIAAAAEMTFE